MADRGSFTVELSVIILSIFFVLFIFIGLVASSFRGLYSPGRSQEDYEEAFLMKIEKLRHEKVLREER